MCSSDLINSTLETGVSETTLKQTPLNAMHRRLGGRMVEFGGWDMPVQYPAGTVEEHAATRSRAGLFDVSHMGEIEVRGADAIAFVNRLCSNDASDRKSTRLNSSHANISYA